MPPSRGISAHSRTSSPPRMPLYRRGELAFGQRIGGPAIIEEYGATTVMPPSWSLRADRYRNLILASGR